MHTTRLTKVIEPKEREKPFWLEAGSRLRIMLIQPPVSGGVLTILPHFQSGEGIGHKPPLGLLSIATYLKQHSDHDIRILDCLPRNLSIAETVALVSEFSPHLVGLSAWTELWHPAFLLGRTIKYKFPEIHLTYGGPHISIFPRETLDLSFVDSVIVGDGEVPFFYLANMLANKQKDNSCPGLHFKEYGVKAYPETFHIQQNLDELPAVDRTLLPLNDYNSVLGRENISTTMVTSRGCPNACVFCKLNFQKTICRSARSIIDEFVAIRDLGYREVEIYDDTFTWSRQRVRDICEGLIQLDLGVKWAIRDRVSNASEELLQLMRRAGCIRINYGVESGSDRILNVVKKKITTSQARNAVAMAKQLGYEVLCFFMFGNPTETKEEMRQTIAFALELDPDYCEFSVAIPYPGTQMYEDALTEGIISYDYWTEFAKNPPSNFTIPQLIETHASRGELIALHDEAYRLFYFRPKYMLRQALHVRNIGELKRKAQMAFRLFRSVFRWQCKRQ